MLPEPRRPTTPNWTRSFRSCFKNLYERQRMEARKLVEDTERRLSPFVRSVGLSSLRYSSVPCPRPPLLLTTIGQPGRARGPVNGSARTTCCAAVLAVSPDCAAGKKEPRRSG